MEYTENFIFEELRKMGYNFSHVGTYYLKEVIELIYKSNNRKVILQGDAYKEIAKNHLKKEITIKSNITKATDYMNKVRLEEAIKSKIETEKLTSKAVINSVLLKLYM